MATRTRKNVEDKISMQSKNIRQWGTHSEAQARRAAVAIEKKRRENELLKEQLENLQRSLNVARSVEISHEITTLSEARDALMVEIDKKRRSVNELRQNIKFLEDKVMDARIDMGGVNVAKENTNLIHKQIKILENRLDKALIKFNEVVAMNKNLRDQIENLRQERIVFDNIYKKMERELHDKKKEMASIIEESNEAYEERDKTNNQYRALRQKRKEELSKLDDQFKEMDKIIQRDNEINEKIRQKEKERYEQMMLSGVESEDENRAKWKTGQSGWDLAEQKNNQIISGEKLKYYEDGLKKIETATGMSVEELIEKFVIAEDNNFSMFTYVNELNSEIEKLEEQISESEEELSRYKGDGAASDAQKKQQLEGLQRAVILAEELAQEYQSKYEKTSQILQKLCIIVQDSFVTLGCDEKVITELLGTSGVADSNIMVHLGIIEQRTNEFLHKRLAMRGEADGAKIIVGPQYKLGSIRLKIEPPSTGGDDNDEDDSEDEENPLTREELAKRSTMI